jgi:hypothetical protein
VRRTTVVVVISAGFRGPSPESDCGRDCSNGETSRVLTNSTRPTSAMRHSRANISRLHKPLYRRMSSRAIMLYVAAKGQGSKILLLYLPCRESRLFTSKSSGRVPMQRANGNSPMLLHILLGDTRILASILAAVFVCAASAKMAHREQFQNYLSRALGQHVRPLALSVCIWEYLLAVGCLFEIRAAYVAIVLTMIAFSIFLNLPGVSRRTCACFGFANRPSKGERTDELVSSGRATGIVLPTWYFLRNATIGGLGAYLAAVGQPTSVRVAIVALFVTLLGAIGVVQISILISLIHYRVTRAKFQSRRVLSRVVQPIAVTTFYYNRSRELSPVLLPVGIGTLRAQTSGPSEVRSNG